MSEEKAKSIERFHSMEAWILWNPKRMQFGSGFHAVPTLYPNRKEAEGAIPLNHDESMLNDHWRPMKVRIVPVRRRKSSGEDKPQCRAYKSANGGKFPCVKEKGHSGTHMNNGFPPDDVEALRKIARISADRERMYWHDSERKKR